MTSNSGGIVAEDADQIVMAALEAVGFFDSIGLKEASDNEKRNTLAFPLNSDKHVTRCFDKKHGEANSLMCCCNLCMCSNMSGYCCGSDYASGSKSKDPSFMPNPPRAQTSGLHLSAGQCELVAVARALVRKRPVLLLDEAAAAADAKVSEQVHKAVICSGATVITICHRLSHVADYDAVVVMEQGKIVEFGRPGDLATRVGGKYFGMMESWRQNVGIGKNKDASPADDMSEVSST